LWLCLLAACLPTSPTTAQGPGAGILFIGNSLTYWNELPLIVQAMFDTAQGPRYEVFSVTSPDVSLEDHWRSTNARTHVDRGGWQIVVLQQGPSSLPENRALLRAYTRRFADRITAIGARPALYSVWPSRGRSYRLAAADVGGLFFPVADAWRAAWRRDSTVALYSADGLHPSLHGSYLAALVMYAVIAGKTPIGLPAVIRLRDGRRFSIEPTLAALLQAAAEEVVRR
jgi:hypothetical protein